MCNSNKKYLIASVALLTFVTANTYAFDFGQILSNAVDNSVNKVVNDSTGNLSNSIHRAISSAIPSLQPGAKMDNGESVNLNKGVIIFGYDGCPYCRQAYAFLNKNGVKYKLMDTQKDAAASRIARENGISGVPVIYVEGEKMVGFRDSSYRNLLQKHGKL